MAHSPVVQTGHPAGLQCQMPGAASLGLSAWMAAGSLSLPLPVLVPDRMQAVSSPEVTSSHEHSTEPMLQPARHSSAPAYKP